MPAPDPHYQGELGAVEVAGNLHRADLVELWVAGGAGRLRLPEFVSWKNSPAPSEHIHHLQVFVLVAVVVVVVVAARLFDRPLSCRWDVQAVGSWEYHVGGVVLVVHMGYVCY